MKIRQLIDKAHVWAIMRFGGKLPDLQQTPRPTSGKVYYYFGRWFRLKRRDNETTEWAKYVVNTRGKGPTTHYDNMEEMLNARLCANCHLHQLGLPCVKRNPGTDRDLCLRYRYVLVTGKPSDNVIPE